MLLIKLLNDLGDEWLWTKITENLITLDDMLLTSARDTFQMGSLSKYQITNYQTNTKLPNHWITNDQIFK